MTNNPNRRQAVQIIALGGVTATLLLPSRWTKPVIETFVVPAHAQASPPRTTATTEGPTTPIGPTTTAEATTTETTTTTTTTTTTPIPIPTRSDIRLKRDIVRVGALPGGLALYRFRYLWSDRFYVGVMAQDVLKVMPEAVITGKDGLFRVRYDLLGFRMVEWEQWAGLDARGLAA